MLNIEDYVPDWMILDCVLYIILWVVVGCIILPYLAIGSFLCGHAAIGCGFTLLTIFAIMKLIMNIKFLIYAKKTNEKFLGDLQKEIKRIKKETISLSPEKLDEWKETMHIK